MSQDPKASKGDKRTIRLAFEESRALAPLHTSWFDAVDTKIVSVFTVASVIVAIAPPLISGGSASALSLGLQFGAVVAFILAASFCYDGFKPRDFRVGPHPSILEEEWLHLTPTEYRLNRLRDIGKSHTLNLAQINHKTSCLRWAMLFTALEVLALVAAFLSLDVV